MSVITIYNQQNNSGDTENVRRSLCYEKGEADRKTTDYTVDRNKRWTKI